MYQLPHLSFAINGLENDEWGEEYEAATSQTNDASRRMEFRRFEIERVERLSSLRVREKLWFACSLKMRSDVVRFAIVGSCPSSH